MLDKTRHPSPPEPPRRRGPPPGCEQYKNINWDRLTPEETWQVCLFAAALQEIRRNELELLRLSTVGLLSAMNDALRGLNAEMRAERLSHDRSC